MSVYTLADLLIDRSKNSLNNNNQEIYIINFFSRNLFIVIKVQIRFMKQRIIKKLQLLYISEKLTLIQAFLTRGHFRPPPLPPPHDCKRVELGGAQKMLPFKRK